MKRPKNTTTEEEKRDIYKARMLIYDVSALNQIDSFHAVMACLEFALITLSLDFEEPNEIANRIISGMELIKDDQEK